MGLCKSFRSEPRVEYEWGRLHKLRTFWMLIGEHFYLLRDWWTRVVFSMNKRSATEKMFKELKIGWEGAWLSEKVIRRNAFFCKEWILE